MKLSTEENVQNLESIIDTQLDMKTLVDMDDLENAIKEGCSAAPTFDEHTKCMRSSQQLRNNHQHSKLENSLLAFPHQEFVHLD